MSTRTSATSPSRPSITPTFLTPIPGLEPDPIQKITPADLDENNNLLHDLILFGTQWPFPLSQKYFQEFKDLTGSPPEFPARDYILWAISPDGTRMGRLTPEGQNTMLFMPRSPDQKPVVVEYGIHLNNPNILTIPLPMECYTYERPADYCKTFEFSADGRYLSYTFNESNCSRTLSIMDTQTREVIYQNEVNGYYPEFTNNGKAFIVGGQCEGGETLLVDLETGKEQIAGDYAWSYEWNAAQDALVVQVHPYQGLTGNSFWGYDVRNDRLFSPPKIDIPLDSPATWVPAGTDILYNHFELLYNESDFSYTPKAPGQIVRMNLGSGKTQVILSDLHYDYWLCERCVFTHPDWVQVMRSRISANPGELASNQASVIDCLGHGECLMNRETMALNWRTGELLPWEQAPAAPPTPTPTGRYKPRQEDLAPLPPGPNAKPLYTHPSGDFAFYLGADGTSLWRVIRNGQPVLWVENGENFIYLP